MPKIGYHHTKIVKEQIRQYRLGKPSGNKGKKHKGVGGRKKGCITWNKGKKCSQLAGKNCHLWKGGITTENMRIRTSIEIRLWRGAVFARDNFTDQKTGVRGGELVAHHIENFSSHPELRFAIDNGITLSEKAHKEFHKKYGERNNSREQLLEFLNIK